MTLHGLDELDRRILHELQRDARHVSSRDIADRVEASPSTIRKRITRLEETGVLTGYHATVDYERAGYQLHVQVTCTAPIPERDEACAAALAVDGVVAVRELATGEQNVEVTAVGQDGDDLARITAALSDVGLTVVDEVLVRSDRSQAYSGFDVDDVSERSADDG